MKKLALLLFAFLALTARASATDIDIGASSIVGFNSANAGADTALSNVSVTLDSPSATCSNCLPQSAVGLAGMKVSLGTPAVTYEIASVASRSAFTLTTNYAASTGTVSGTLHKFVHLRIYVTSPFVPSGSTTVIQSGSVGSTAWYRRYGVSIINDGAQNIAYVPAVNDLPATTDSSNPTATYVAGLWTQGGGFMQSYPGCVDEFRLSHLTTPTSWAQICQFNLPPTTPPPNPTTFLSEQQINARFPSCTTGQLIYYAATGNVQSCLSLSSDFSINAGVLSLQSGITRIQEEGSNLPLQPTLNFVGSAATAGNDAGNSRINVTFATPVNNLASIAANGFYAITGSGATSAVRTLTGTANRIVVTNGDGSGAPTFDIGANVPTNANNLSFFAATTSAQLAGVISDETGSGALAFGTSPSLTTPMVSGGTFTSPRVATSILDSNGNELFGLTATASAVNEFTIANAAVGNRPTLSTTGNDTNIPLEIAPKGAGRVLLTGSGGIEISNAVPVLRTTDTSSSKTYVQTVNGSGDLVIGEEGISNAITVANTTGVATFEEIPVGPASDPTTANQLTRRDYVLTRTTAFSVSFGVADPSTPTVNAIIPGTVTWIAPDGATMTLTKAKVRFASGSHTSGGSVTFTIQQRTAASSWVTTNDFGAVTLDNTNNTINVVYSNDFGDFTVSPGDTFIVFISARSGTVTERDVTVSLYGTQRVQ